MRNARRPVENGQSVIDLPEQPPAPPQEPKVLSPTTPVWTDNKSHFIMRYLRYFVYITKHGTYIDGFAGPQEECETDSWAAKLVLGSEPRRMRHFHLCDANRSQIARLEQLRSEQPIVDGRSKPINRDITIYPGDFNHRVDDILNSGTISEK